MTKAEYINKMYGLLVPMCAKHGYKNVAAGMIAQSIQEGWNSGLATKYFNYWGMKAGESYTGKTVVMDNKKKNDKATYRVFTSMENGCEGYFKFLEYPRYKSLKSCTSDFDYLDKIGPCGWNSNTEYGNHCKKHLKDVYAALGNVSVPSDCVVGSTYITQHDLYVRDNPDGNKVKFENLTDNAKEHAKKDLLGYGILEKGTRVTCIGIRATQTCTWIKIPSGWICARNSKNIYVL